MKNEGYKRLKPEKKKKKNPRFKQETLLWQRTPSGALQQTGM
jgi:hypothetical protein